ncbi:MAG TPA: hypothetical protein VK775_20315 [Chthoniobacterales bacterium]|nr:hypothetical protein [Chthoniobacterales bacterium]
MSNAIAHYQKALEIKPLNVGFQNNLALVLATCPTDSLRVSGQSNWPGKRMSFQVGVNRCFFAP